MVKTKFKVLVNCLLVVVATNLFLLYRTLTHPSGTSRLPQQTFGLAQKALKVEYSVATGAHDTTVSLRTTAKRKYPLDYQERDNSKVGKRCSVISKDASGRVVEEVFNPTVVNNMSLFYCYPTALNYSELVYQTRRGKISSAYPLNSYPYTPLTKLRCGNETVFIIYLIKSRPENVKARNAIRSTWASENNTGNVNIKRVFLLGLSTNHNILPTILDEHKEYGDILLENFADVYLHTRIKMTMGIRWATSSCNNASFLVLADDDVFIWPKKMVSLLSSDEIKKHKRLYMGSLQQKQHPHRHMPNKWYLSTIEYPFEDFPPFPPTGTVIVNMQFAQQFAIAWRYIRVVHYDDVYLGIVAHKLGVKPLHTNLVRVHCHSYEVAQKTTAACLGEFSPEKIRSLWKTHYK